MERTGEMPLGETSRLIHGKDWWDATRRNIILGSLNLKEGLGLGGPAGPAAGDPELETRTQGLEETDMEELERTRDFALGETFRLILETDPRIKTGRLALGD